MVVRIFKASGFVFLSVVLLVFGRVFSTIMWKDTQERYLHTALDYLHEWLDEQLIAEGEADDGEDGDEDDKKDDNEDKDK